MKLFNFFELNIISTFRFVARLFSVLLVLVILSLAIGEGFPSPANLTTTELLLTISLIIMLTGLLLAWKWEFIGGIIIIIGFLVFFIINSVHSGYLRLGYFFIVFPITGLLYLFCGWKRKIN